MILDENGLAALQPDWLLSQAKDHYRQSCNRDRKPSTRETSRRKFIAAMKALLPIMGKDKLLGNFPVYDSCEARAIIESLAQAPADKLDSSAFAALANHLSKAPAELAAALRLL